MTKYLKIPTIYYLTQTDNDRPLVGSYLVPMAPVLLHLASLGFIWR